MYKQKLLFFVIFLATCVFNITHAQVTASPTTGCVPTNISFTGPAGTNILWTFGDGGTSVLQNPGHIYTQAGNYIVTYTSSAGTYTTAVKISPTPTANFSFNAPAIKCAPMTVTFQNTSISPTVITSYQWNFGNGVPSGVQSPTYTYPGAGSFTINLTITDANGCSGTVSAGPVNVSSPPLINISTNPSPPSGCTAPFICAFSGSNSTSGSPIPGPLNFNWSFPGGAPGTSGAMTPGNVTYNLIGNYNVTLTVTDNNNCSASQSIPVNVSQPAVAVTMPSVICIYDSLKANDNSTAGYSVWQFGDGQSAVAFPTPPPTFNVKHLYSTPGLKTLTITAYGGGTCTATLTKTLMVEQVTAAITSTPPSFSCSSPFINQYFNASSPNAVNYFWSATNCNGTTFTSNVANPTFTFSQGSLNPYTIFPYCIPSIQLIATSINGCTNSAVIAADTLRKPTAWFNKNKKEGCVPLSVTFRDSSFAHLAPQSIIGYTWNNGAQPPTIVSGPPPTFTTTTFTYTTTGTFTPYLIIQTSQGCIDTSFIDTVVVASPAPLNFSFSPSVVCPNQTVQIINTSPNQNQIQHWHVTSDAGFFSGCVNNPNPGWVFTHIGLHTFTLSAWKNSCMSSTTIPQTVEVKGPIVQSRFETNCSNRLNVFFATHLQDVNVASLNFGDGTPTVSITGNLGGIATHTINHLYANTGDYTATVIGYNGITGTCSPYTYTMDVKVRDVQAGIVLSPTACVSSITSFSSNSTDVLVGCPNIGYTWYFDNAPPVVTSLTAVSYSFNTPGTHTVVLQVKDLNSCSDTVIRTIRISSAAPQFTAVPSKTICLSSGTIQLNNTTPQVPDAITGYIWNFGDGSPTSTLTSPLHNYTTAAVPNSTYMVSLTATNVLGCIATVTQVIQVNNPSALMSVSPSRSICVQQGVNIAAPAGYQTYSLSFGDGSPVSVTSNSSTAHAYTQPGIYTVNIEITDLGGCKNSSSLTMNVQSYPVADFTIISQGATQPNIACLGNNITFSSTSTSSPTYNLSYNWDIGNGANIQPLQAVVASYNNTGLYPVTLTVTTPNGCKDMVTKNVRVYGAKANIELDKSTICLGQTITFNVKNDSSGVFAWVWDFGEGTTTNTIMAVPLPSPTISLTYTNYPLPNGSTKVKLAYFSGQYACRYFAEYPIQIIKVNTSFDRNNETALLDSVHCLGSSDKFTNTSPNPGNLQYNWSFGDGNSSSLQDPVHTYSAAGIYQVVMTVTESINNCIGTTMKNMTVNPLPTVSITARDTCADAIFPLIGSTSPNTSTYTWTPTQGVTNPSLLITSASASVSTTYTLSTTDVNGCVGSTSFSVYIQQPPKNIKWDTTVIVGQNIPVNGIAGPNLSYTWTPSTGLNCTNCPTPVSTSTDNITYSVTIADFMGCFQRVNIYDIKVDPKATVDVPTAFTPNGDGTNDVIYVDGWGIKKLNYFRIYNRWGQLLFESNDIKIGWDGIFNGVPQNMETYVYQVSVETFVDKEPFLKTGSFKLIR